MAYSKINVPNTGEKIQVQQDGSLQVPNQPIIPYIEGDGIGIDITPVMLEVVNAAVAKAYGNDKKIAWMEVFAGEKANNVYNEQIWLPDETLEAIKEFKIAIKGPLTTPVGGGIRSINVAIRQQLDLYVCQRPVQYFTGTPSPLAHPELVDMIIFRENSEDIYAGIEWQADTPENQQVIDFLTKTMGVTKINSPVSCGIGIKPVSKFGSQRLIRRAIQYAIDNNRKTVTIVHKGNIMKFTEGAFKEWGYQLAAEEFGAKLKDGGPWMTVTNPKTNQEILINDCIADAFLQQILLKPAEQDVVATLNLNGDYISDALAAQVGGIGIAPGANLNDSLGVFEATHGTAPGYAGKDKVNPCSLILSAEMMLRHLGWVEAADMILKGVSGGIASKKVTYDFARFIDDATELKCSEFGKQIISCF